MFTGLALCRLADFDNRQMPPAFEERDLEIELQPRRVSRRCLRSGTRAGAGPVLAGLEPERLVGRFDAMVDLERRPAAHGLVRAMMVVPEHIQVEFGLQGRCGKGHGE